MFISNLVLHMDMTKRLWFLLIIFLCISMVGISLVSAHPPGNLELSFDYNTSLLQVTTVHQVIDPTDHYIKEIVIDVGGVKDHEWIYISQPDVTRFSYLYPVSVKKGDIISVSAECNKYGSLKSSMVAEVDSISEDIISEPTDSVPPFAQSPAVAQTGVQSASSVGFSSAGILLILVVLGFFYRRSRQ